MSLSAKRGLIPAHAGKTQSPGRRHRPRPAHPRSRGENDDPVLAHALCRGSSPLTRGKRGAPLPFCAASGLIPAHAGKTLSSRRRMRSVWAHPRSRGENADERLNDLPRHRLIPAHAGKTSGTRSRPSPSPAHPRSRGENPSRPRWALLCAGSSPLTRGKPPRGPPGEVGRGLIPAHAGKTTSILFMVSGGRAHPRSRGENVVFPLLCVAALGSSPLTRGKQAS